jgi:SAM-dependent methyltransferase
VTIDPRAATGFANRADVYDRVRPSYPRVAVATVARSFGLSDASTALDLAAGTGKLTRVVVELVGRVIAVEPSQPMLAELRAQLPRVDAISGTAEAIPLVRDSVDAVFVGEAFHWFDAAEACREIARVLRPGGGLALLWNRARWTEADLPWLPTFDALVKPYRQAAGPFPAERERWTVPLQETRLFAPPSSAETDNLHRLSADDFVALVGSWTWIANLPDQERADVLAAVRDLLGDQPSVTLRYRTEIHSTHLA